MYGLILSGIGFIYVGFAWMDIPSLIQNCVQAIVFLFLGYFGVRNWLILAAGYFLHGCWDLAYSFINEPGLVPPQYDLFCLSLDFTIGAYILLFKKHFQVSETIA
jgi:hypothetical protein